MSLVNQSRAPRFGAIAAATLVAVTPAWCYADQADIQSEAAALLKNSMAYLSGLQKFSLETHSTIEVVLVDGQKLQFDHDTETIVQRPNRMYAKRLGELAEDEFFYDGKTLTQHFPEAGYYASVEVPDTLEGMLDFATMKLDIVAPAGEFIYSNAYELLMQDVQSGFVVGTPAYVNGAVCDHLAFRGPDTDFQIWIQQGEQPLPRKLVITSRDIMNAPQFSVDLRHWNLEPMFTEDTFQFDAPETAKSIEFMMLAGESE